jgi:hypothetical protein
MRTLFLGLVWIDGYLYYSGRVDTTLPFEELRRRSLIDEPANEAAGAPDFPTRVLAVRASGNVCRLVGLSRRPCRPASERARRRWRRL